MAALDDNGVLNGVLDAVSAIVVVLDRDGRIVWCNRAHQEAIGYTLDEVRGRCVWDWMPIPEEVEKVKAIFREPGIDDFPRKDDNHWACKNGQRRFIAWSNTALLDANGSVKYVVGTGTDITESKRQEQPPHFTALHDSLTSLPSRALFEERLERALRRSRRYAGFLYAVLFVDLDHFKLINDSHGHQVGDRLLVEVGGRLTRCIRDTDTVARFGGDEFAILLENLGHPGRVEEVAERILAAVREPFRINQHEVFTTCSLGIAMGHSADRSWEDILRNADIAMYRAKDTGRDCSMTFDVSMHVEVLKRTSLETQLRGAIERRELRLHYQEIRAISSGRLVGMEALLRWRHRELGLLRPERFLSVAEDTGLIVPIGRWVFEEACHQMALWQKQGYTAFSLSINLSGRELAQPDLVDRLAELLQTTGIGGDALTVEITETAIMENIAVATQKLERLQSLGVRVAIDDFGTGYSSLSRLKNLPIDTIKIDQSFVRDLRQAGQDSSLVEAMINVGHSLSLTTVAEGVETVEQLARLRELGCDYGQGNYLSPPFDRCLASPGSRHWGDWYKKQNPIQEESGA